MSWYLGETTNPDPTKKIAVRVLRYYDLDKSNRIRNVEIVRGNNDEILTNFIDRQVLIAGMSLVISVALARNEKYKNYPYMQEGNVDPKQCEYLDYRYNEDYVTITSDYGDYATIRWGKIREKLKGESV